MQYILNVRLAGRLQGVDNFYTSILHLAQTQNVRNRQQKYT